MARRTACAIALVVGIWTLCPSAQVTKTATSFAALIDRLSEPGGDFGGDNLISNEQSYLQVMPALEGRHVTGGAYVGVGPDQNFSYIAQVRPAVAFIIDIRRDNLLLHLLFKALFAISPTRVEYPQPADRPSAARAARDVDGGDDREARRVYRWHAPVRGTRAAGASRSPRGGNPPDRRRPFGE